MKFVSWTIQTRMHNLTSRNLSSLATQLSLLHASTEQMGSAKACSHLNVYKFSTKKYNYKAKSTGLHRNVSPPPQSFAFELVGLFVRKARATKQFGSKKIKDSKNKSARSTISNAFWSIPGISHKEKETMIKYRSGTIYIQKMLSVSSSPTAFVAPSAPAKTVHSTPSQGSGTPS